MKIQTELKHATVGTISHGTLRTEDLLTAFISELEWQMSRNGDYYSQPENFTERDSLTNLIGEAHDCFSAYRDEIDPDKEDSASELVNETFPNAFERFCAPYMTFSAHPGDGSDFGFWIDTDAVVESCGESGFVSSKDQEYPADDYQGEWLHVNERGNCTLYIRANGVDKEIWGVV